MEILLYGYIYDWSVSDAIAQIDASKGAKCSMRVNSFGGSVFSNWGLIAKVQEHGNVQLKADGMAGSSAANLFLYGVNNECLDVTRFIFHRADAEYSNEEQKTMLHNINAELRKKMEAKMPAALWQDVAGYSYDQLFDPENRINVTLNAEQALKLGLVSKVNKITPSQAKEINAFYESIAAVIDGKPKEQIIIPEQKIVSTQKMDINKLRSEHPEVYQQVFDLGVSTERDRVEACLVFAEVDLPGVKAAIEGGKALSAKQMSEFSLKVMAKGEIKEIEANSAGGMGTGDPGLGTPKSEKEKTLETFEASLDKKLGLVK